MSTDIVVTFDTTGSMMPCLMEVRRKVTQFIEDIFSKVDNLRVGIIAHGDYCDDRSPYVTKAFQLSNKPADLISFVNSVERTSGGDSDECYEYVLKELTTFDWNADNNVIVMIGDAQPHDIGYRYGSFHVGYNLDWRNTLDALVANGIKVYPVQCLGRHDAKGFYKTLAQKSGTPKLELHQFTNIVPLLTAVAYKQQSDDQVKQYADTLRDTGQLDRNMAHVFNLLLNAKDLIGGIDLAPVETSDSDNLKPVSPYRFQMLHVDKETPIRDFVESTGAIFRTGRGFYELTKTETVQERKEIVLRDNKGDMFTGRKARQMLGIPYGERGKLRPRKDLGYSVFVQSTSYNRKLMPGTRFLYEAT